MEMVRFDSEIFFKNPQKAQSDFNEQMAAVES